ncbi:MAG: PAS domain S-box protein [Terriglobia bacterium]
MLERELFRLLEGTADPAFSVDTQGLICSWNRAAERLFGFPASEVLQQPCASLFQGRGTLGAPVCSDTCDVLDCAVAGREVTNYDLEVNARGGRTLWVNISILVFSDPRTGRRLVVHLARDITERKRTEELTQKLVEAAKQLMSRGEVTSPQAPVSPLTEQEKRVLRLLAKGKRPADVARELGVTPRTLRNHISHANRKLRTRNRLEAVVHATRRGLI